MHGWHTAGLPGAVARRLHGRRWASRTRPSHVWPTGRRDSRATAEASAAATLHARSLNMKGRRWRSAGLELRAQEPRVDAGGRAGRGSRGAAAGPARAPCTHTATCPTARRPWGAGHSLWGCPAKKLYTNKRARGNAHTVQWGLPPTPVSANVLTKRRHACPALQRQKQAQAAAGREKPSTSWLARHHSMPGPGQPSNQHSTPPAAAAAAAAAAAPVPSMPPATAACASAAAHSPMQADQAPSQLPAPPPSSVEEVGEVTGSQDRA